MVEWFHLGRCKNRFQSFPGVGYCHLHSVDNKNIGKELFRSGIRIAMVRNLFDLRMKFMSRQICMQLDVMVSWNLPISLKVISHGAVCFMIQCRSVNQTMHLDHAVKNY